MTLCYLGTSCASPLPLGAACGVSHSGKWQYLRMLSVVAFLPYREISDLHYIKGGEGGMQMRRTRGGEKGPEVCSPLQGTDEP